MSPRLIDETASGQLAHAPIGIVCFDALANASYCNSCAAELLEMSREQVLRGEWEDLDWRIDTHPMTSGKDRIDDGDAASYSKTEIRKLLRQARPYEGILRRDPPSGECRWLQIAARPFSPPGVPDGGLIVSLADVTELMRARESIRHVEQKWREASRAKSEFIANLSHEIRTPLTAILGFSELLASRQEGDLQAIPPLECVQPIIRNAKHVLSLVDDALDLSKIEAGQLAIDCIPSDLRQFLHDTACLMSGPAARKSIDLCVETRTAVPAIVNIDETRFRQILNNLIGNAINYTRRGRVDVRVRYQADSARTGRIKISVCDTGIGMNPSQLAQLFRRFSRANRSGLEFSGTGLGLQISQELAGLLGGRIRVRSREGVGSLFRLTLPLKFAEEIRWAPPSTIWHGGGGPAPEFRRPADEIASSAPSPNPERPLDGMRIYLAEDGPDNQLILSHLLRLAGANVTVFDNGESLLRSFADTPPGTKATDPPAHCDLIVTDMLMPKMDGYEMVATLRDRGYALPIVALTANAMKGDEERCLLTGCDAYASKPIDRHQLIETCARCLAGKRVSNRPSAGSLPVAVRPAGDAVAE